MCIWIDSSLEEWTTLLPSCRQPLYRILPIEQRDLLASLIRLHYPLTNDFEFDRCWHHLPRQLRCHHHRHHGDGGGDGIIDESFDASSLFKWPRRVVVLCFLTRVGLTAFFFLDYLLLEWLPTDASESCPWSERLDEDDDDNEDVESSELGVCGITGFNIIFCSSMQYGDYNSSRRCSVNGGGCGNSDCFFLMQYYCSFLHVHDA